MTTLKYDLQFPAIISHHIENLADLEKIKATLEISAKDFPKVTSVEASTLFIKEGILYSNHFPDHPIYVTSIGDFMLSRQGIQEFYFVRSNGTDQITIKDVPDVLLKPVLALQTSFFGSIKPVR